MAISAHSAQRRYTYADLEEIPDDKVIRAIIDGELLVTPAPVTRHQDAAGNINDRLRAYARTTGGKAYFAPYGVYFSEDNFVQPDLIFIGAAHLERNGPKYMQGAPDLVVEISSPSTRRVDQTRKRDLYERFGVPNYWFIDLEAEQVQVHVLENGRYPDPQVKKPGEILVAAGLPGLTVPVTEALGGQDHQS